MTDGASGLSGQSPRSFVKLFLKMLYQVQQGSCAGVSFIFGQSGDVHVYVRSTFNGSD